MDSLDNIYLWSLDCYCFLFCWRYNIMLRSRFSSTTESFATLYRCQHTSNFLVLWSLRRCGSTTFGCVSLWFLIVIFFFLTLKSSSFLSSISILFLLLWSDSVCLHMIQTCVLFFQDFYLQTSDRFSSF